MLVEAYSFGCLRVNGNEHNSDVILGPQGVKEGWRRKHSHLLEPEDLGPALAMEPVAMVVGTGKFGLMRVSDRTRRFLREQGIHLIVQRTGVAWRTFNRLAANGERVVAALHIFC